MKHKFKEKMIETAVAEPWVSRVGRERERPF